MRPVMLNRSELNYLAKMVGRDVAVLQKRYGRPDQVAKRAALAALGKNDAAIIEIQCKLALRDRLAAALADELAAETGLQPPLSGEEA